MTWPRRPRAIACLLLALAAPAAAQTLGRDAARFTVDGRPAFLLFVSYFDGLRRAGADAKGVDADFEYLKRIGVDGVRVLPNWEYGCGGGPTDAARKLFRPDGAINDAMWPVFVRLLERAAFHGLVVDVTFTRDTYDPPLPLDAYRSAVAAAAGRLRGLHPHVLFDVQNEYPIHDLKAADVHGILKAVEAADPARLVTASGGGGDIVHDPLMDVVAYHDTRESDWHQVEVIGAQLAAIGKVVAPTVKPIYFQEPMPFRRFHPGCGHGEWPRPGYARRAAGHARDQGAAAWTFHTRQSFDLRERTLVEILMDDAEQKRELEAVAAGL